MSSASPDEETALLANKNDEATTTTTPKDDDTQQHSIQQDIWDTLTLGFPIFCTMITWVGMKTTDTALLGHVSGQALSASALADLYTMCTAVFVQVGVLSILCGNAIGADNPTLAGIYLQVSLVVLALVVVVVMLIWQFTSWFWIQLGTDPDLAGMAGYYARVMSFGLPANLVLTQLTQFFQAQKIMHPEVQMSTVALVLNLVLGVVLVLGVGGYGGYGFAACPAVTVGVVYVQLGLLWFIYVYWQQLHKTCWAGWDLAQITAARIQTYVNLWLPAALGLASDFWRVAVIGTAAASLLGETAVAVFNTSYRIMWIVLIMVNALSSAAGIQTTLRLGKQDAVGAKQAGEVGIYMSAAVLVVVGGLVVWQTRALGRIFTADPDFLDQLEAAKWPFMTTLVLMNLSVALERIPYSMGRTQEVFWYGFVASWGGQVPAVLLCLHYWRADLFGLYSGMTIGYSMLAVLYGYMCFTSDWEYFAQVAQERSERPPAKKEVE